MGAAVRLSTFDNPINPFDDFSKWYWWDTVMLHHNTCEVLDKEARTSEQFSEAENRAEIERAIDDIIAHDMTGILICLLELKRSPNEPMPKDSDHFEDTSSKRACIRHKNVGRGSSKKHPLSESRRSLKILRRYFLENNSVFPL